MTAMYAISSFFCDGNSSIGCSSGHTAIVVPLVVVVASAAGAVAVLLFASVESTMLELPD